MVVNDDISENTTKSNAISNSVHFKKQRKEPSNMKYEGLVADANLRQASEGGYLIAPTKEFLLERCQTAEQPTRSLREIDYIHLAFFHIRKLGHIQSCRQLKICILHNNYLTRFHALANCPCLVRLDLHSNQITKLPDAEFWSHLKKLKVLNLHDNGIGKLESIHSLSACTSLIALTLYDTPLSLKHNYRHHTVNSIWSLKALDHHVIGDDEIIEDATFSSGFSALNTKLFIDLCPKEIEQGQDRTLEVELNVVKTILRNISRILAHGSPVVVMQRWLRGYLSRKRRNISYAAVRARMIQLNFIQNDVESPEGSHEPLSLDYDTYLKNRRPGSKTPSLATTLRTESPAAKQVDQVAKDKPSSTIPRTLEINLAQLEENADRAFCGSPTDNEKVDDDEIRLPPGTRARYTKTAMLMRPADLAVNRSKALESMRRSTAPGPQQQARGGKQAVAVGGGRREPVTVQEMLGAHHDLVHPHVPRPHPVLGTLVEGGKKTCDVLHMDDDVPNHEWRIHNNTVQVAGGRPVVSEVDPVQERMVAVRDAGREIRDAIEFWHDQEFNKPRPVAKKTKRPPKLTDQVSLATLLAVTKAYRDRDRSDSHAAKVEKVMRVQQDRMQAKHIVAAFKSERRSVALNNKQEDRLRLADSLQHQEAAKAAYIEFAQERKERALQRHRERHAELLFASDFSNQHTSVSNALIRHDRQAAVEDGRAEKNEIVESVKTQLAEQAELVRRYMEHKQLSQQMQGSQEKSKLDAKTLQDATDRIMAARMRVAGFKARKAAVQSLQISKTVPSTAATSRGAWTFLLSQEDANRPSPAGPPPTGLPPVVSVTPYTPRRDGSSIVASPSKVQ